MKILLALRLLWPISLFAQSPFDGTWITDTNAMHLPQKPAEYLLSKGVLSWTGREIKTKGIKADGNDQKVPETGHWDTISVRILDDRTVEIIAKKAGKTMLTEVDTVSLDGSTLTQAVKDTTEAQAVTVETLSKRVGRGPAGSHALSGSWRAYKVSRSRNGYVVQYRCTADGFSAETPFSEKFAAKFDGKDYRIEDLSEDDPAYTMVSVRVLKPSTVEQMNKRDGNVVGVLRLTVAPDGKTIHATYENKETNTTASYEMRKQPQ